MKNTQSGFTLIELVVVIVILGILAVTAVPRFIDLSDEAEAAALQGVVGAMSSAEAINYAACAAAGFATGGDCLTSTTCGDVANMMPGGLPAGYTLTDGTLSLGAAAGDSVACEVNQTSSTAKANFTGIYTQ